MFGSEKTKTTHSKMHRLSSVRENQKMENQNSIRKQGISFSFATMATERPSCCKTLKLEIDRSCLMERY